MLREFLNILFGLVLVPVAIVVFWFSLMSAFWFSLMGLFWLTVNQPIIVAGVSALVATLLLSPEHFFHRKSGE